MKFVDKQSVRNPIPQKKIYERKSFMVTDCERGVLQRWNCSDTNRHRQSDKNTEWQPCPATNSLFLKDRQLTTWFNTSFKNIHGCHRKSQLKSISQYCQRAECNVQIHSSFSWTRKLQHQTSLVENSLTSVRWSSCRPPAGSRLRSPLGSSTGRSTSRLQVTENCLPCKATGNKAHCDDPP